MDAHSLLFDVARGSLVLGAALVAMPLLARASGAARRAVLLAAFAIALVSPFAARALAHTPAAAFVAVPVLVRGAPVEPLEVAPSSGPRAVATAAGVAPSLDLRAAAVNAAPAILFGVWALGALVVLARLVVGLVRARRLVARAASAAASPLALAASRAARVAGVAAEVVISDDVDAPAVTGILRSVVLLPREALAWSEARLSAVLLHELAHARRRDCLASAFAQVVVALRWFDPLAWIAAARLRREREIAADESVLAAGVLPSDYAIELLSIAAPNALASRHASVLGMAAPRSEVAARVEAILAPRSLDARRGVGAAWLGVFVVGAGTCAPPAAPADAPAPSPALIFPPPRAEQVSSIDAKLQAFAEAEVAQLRAEWAAPRATAIVLAVKTGEVVAMADEDTARRPYVPGSTFKAITIAAALDAGALRDDAVLDCGNGERAYGDQTMRDWSKFGKLTIGEAIAVSSNVCATRVVDALGDEAFARYLDRFHLRAAFPVAPTGAGAGWARALASVGGGGRVAPIEMAAAYGAIANGGVYLAPTLTRGGVARGEPVLKAETARRVLAILEGAVASERATGKLAHVDGVRVGGKTGTAEWVDEGAAQTRPQAGSRSNEHRLASFIGVVPVDAPRFVVLVAAEDPKDGGSGGKVAAPVFARLAARALSSGDAH